MPPPMPPGASVVSRAADWKFAGPRSELLRGAVTEARTYESAEEMPPEMRKLIVRLMVVQADTEFASIQQHRPWLDRAPTLEDRWAEARIVADEARHGLQACRILRDFGEEGLTMVEELLAKREGEHKLDAFNMKFDRWSDVGAFTCLIDRVGVYQLRAFQECPYGPLARAMPLMLSEEQLHLNFGASVLRRMVEDGPAYYGSKDEVEEAMRRWYPRALDLFGHSTSEASRKAIKFGLRRWTNDVARQKFVEEVRGLARSIGFALPPEDFDRRVW